MEPDVLKYFLTQGPFAVLFVWLLVTTKKESRERETRLHEVLDKFSEKYDLIVDRLDKLEERWRK